MSIRSSLARHAFGLLLAGREREFLSEWAFPSMTAVAGAITDDDIGAVAAFLHQHLNARLSADEWARCAVPPWSVDAPNHGFLLRQGDAASIGLVLCPAERSQDLCRQLPPGVGGSASRAPGPRQGWAEMTCATVAVRRWP